MRTNHAAQPMPSLYEIPPHRLAAARHHAANRATVALLRNRSRAARQWLQIVTDIDAEANRVRQAVAP